MSASFWQAAETWYESHIFLWLILTILPIFCFIFLLIYRSAKYAKQCAIFFCLSFILCGSWTAFQSMKYKSYLNLAGNTTVQIRDRKMTPLGYQYYARWEKNLHVRYYVPDKIRALPFYQEEIVRYPVEYLGVNHGTYYFTYQGQIFCEREFVEFLPDVTQPELLGSQFILTDEDYQEIGFFSSNAIFYKNLIVNEAEREKKYEDVPYKEVKEGYKIFKDWIFATE